MIFILINIRTGRQEKSLHLKSEIRDIYDELLKEGRELEKKVGSLFPKSWVSFGPDFIEQSP